MAPKPKVTKPSEAKKPAAKAPAKPKAGEKSVDKALKVKKALTQGKHTQRKRKLRLTPRFKRPKTLSLPRNPRVAVRSVSKREKLDCYKIIKHPMTSEAAMRKIENHNTLVFIVDIQANKHSIKTAVKKLYNVNVARVNTLNRIGHGDKKAYVKLDASQEAIDVANTIGFI